MRKRRPTVRKQRQKLNGGPFNGAVIRMACPGTLTFTVNGETGRYDHNNNWLPVNNGRRS